MPVHDLKFSQRRAAAMEAERRDGDALARRAWLVPLVVFLIAGGLTLALRGAELGAGVLVAYPIAWAARVLLGTVALWIAAHLWLGGVGSLSIALLNLLATFAVVDLTQHFIGGACVAFILQAVVILVMVWWLFDFDGRDAGYVTALMLLFQVLAYFALMAVLISA